MLVKTFENNGKNISKNIVILNLKQYSNLYCLINWSTYVQRKYVFDKPVNECQEFVVAHHPQKGAIKFYIYIYIYVYIYIYI